MATTRLPQVNGDDGQWGTILNDYLLISHDSNGNLLSSAVSSAGGVTITGTPSDGQTLQYNASSSSWAPATVTSSGSVSDATTSTKGIVQLGGDLAGTSTSAAAPKLAATANVTSIIAANTTVAGAAQKASNLSDLSSVSTARTNLGLSTVAASGSYTDLTNKPTIPTVTGTNSGDQTLSVSGTTLTISGTNGNSVTLPSGGSSSGLTDPTTTKGDLIVHGSSTTRLPVGSDGQILTADSTQTLGVKWATTSSASSLTVKDEGTSLSTAATSFNFVGAGVTATNSSGAITVTVPGASGSGGGYTVAATSATYTAVNGNFVVGNAASSGFTVTLPAAVAGGYVRIKKIDTGSNAILVVAPSGNIDGSASVSINGQYQSQDFMSDGTLWYQV